MVGANGRREAANLSVIIPHFCVDLHFFEYNGRGRATHGLSCRTMKEIFFLQ